MLLQYDCINSKKEKEADQRNAGKRNRDAGGKMQKVIVHTAAEIRWWSPTQLLRSR